MLIRFPRAFAISLLVSAAVLSLDMLSKRMVLQSIPLHGQVPLTPFFNLVRVENHGISFGLFNHGAPLPPLFFVAVTLGIVALLLNWLRKVNKPVLIAALGLLIGGAFGNAFDRLAYGAVVDFLDFHIADLHWPAFNVADSAVVAGVGLVLLQGLVFDKDSKKDA